MTEYYDLGDGIIYGVTGGDAIMNAHRREERQARREAIMKAREQDDTNRHTEYGNSTDRGNGKRSQSSKSIRR